MNTLGKKMYINALNLFLRIFLSHSDSVVIIIRLDHLYTRALAADWIEGGLRATMARAVVGVADSVMSDWESVSRLRVGCMCSGIMSGWRWGGRREWLMARNLCAHACLGCEVEGSAESERIITPNRKSAWLGTLTTRDKGQYKKGSGIQILQLRKSNYNSSRTTGLSSGISGSWLGSYPSSDWASTTTWSSSCVVTTTFLFGVRSTSPLITETINADNSFCFRTPRNIQLRSPIHGSHVQVDAPSYNRGSVESGPKNSTLLSDWELFSSSKLPK